MVLHTRRQAEPPILTPPKSNRWGAEGRGVKRTHSYPADGGVAVSLPIERASAIRAKMKSNAIAAVGVAFVDLSLTVEAHPLFRITGTEMESGAGASRGRAFETAIGIAVANYPAPRCDGHSFAVDAYGGIIVLADASPGLVLATFDLAAIRRTRDEERFRRQI